MTEKTIQAPPPKSNEGETETFKSIGELARKLVEGSRK
jgi:hypothetical protein